MAQISGGMKIAAALQRVARKKDARVKVGFLSGATYPDGTAVAMVATVNEFGAPSRGQPPRPFFRDMIARNKAGWPGAIAANLKATDFDGRKTLDRMGQGIKAQLQTSIRDFTDPPLAPSTIARKGFSKPLIDTGLMVSSVDYVVEDE